MLILGAGLGEFGLMVFQLAPSLVEIEALPQFSVSAVVQETLSALAGQGTAARCPYRVNHLAQPGFAVLYPRDQLEDR